MGQGKRILIAAVSLLGILVPVLLAASPANAASILNQGGQTAQARIAAAASGPAAAVTRKVPAAESSASAWTRQDLLEAVPADSARRSAPSGFPHDDSLGRPTVSGAATSNSWFGDSVISDPTVSPWRLHGKVFFRVGEDHFSCSGTVVSSKRKNVIFTAGRCAWDPDAPPDLETGKKWVKDMIFVPGYRLGDTTLGVYNATAMVAPQGWVDDELGSYDLAAIALDRKIQTHYGARKLNFAGNPKGRKYSIFGYPAAPAGIYDGGQLIRCGTTGYTFDDKQPVPHPIAAKPCLMREGASGGGWINKGFLTSVSSYTKCETNPNLCATIFGPQFGEAAVSIYTNSMIRGSSRPTLKVRSAPPRKVRKRRVAFRFRGSGDTPVKNFRLKLDRQKPVVRSGRIVISRLSRGKHVLRVRSMDQTGHLSKRVIKRVFRVLPKRR